MSPVIVVCYRVCVCNNTYKLSSGSMVCLEETVTLSDHMSAESRTTTQAQLRANRTTPPVVSDIHGGKRDDILKVFANAQSLVKFCRKWGLTMPRASVSLTI